MKKLLSFFVGLTLVVAIGFVAYLAYLHFQKTEQRAVKSVVPKSAVFMVETNNLTKAWQKLTESYIWGKLAQAKSFRAFSETAKTIDTYFQKNGLADLALKNRRLLASGHMVSGQEMAFLFVVDLQKASTIAAVQNGLALSKYKQNKRMFKEFEIIELTNVRPGINISLTYIDNLLIASTAPRMVEEAISLANGDLPALSPNNWRDWPWADDPVFVELEQGVAPDKLFRLYVNYNELPLFVRSMSKEDSQALESLRRNMRFSGFTVDFDQEQLYLDGLSLLDTVPSYWQALAQVAPGTMDAQRVISNQAAVLMSLNFSSFPDFRAQLREQFRKEDPKALRNYEGSLKTIEALLGISFDKQLFSWIDGEIAVAKLRPNEHTQVDDLIVAIRAKSGKQAKDGLQHIMQKVKKRSPISFQTEMHRNFPIYFLEVNGMFKMLFGDIFGKMEKPHFTFVENYMLISNSASTLKENLNHYINAMTLSRSGKFMDFKAKFNPKANLNIFVQPPKAYAHLYHYSNHENQKTLKENKDLILNFSHLGIQLVANNKRLNTYLLARYDSTAHKTDALEMIELESADALFYKQVERREFALQHGQKLNAPDGRLVVHHSGTEMVRFEGNVQQHKLEGVGRYYYPNGNLMATVTYKNGLLEGHVNLYFRHANQSKKAEALFRNNRIEGKYVEFYRDGTPKAQLKYAHGLANGKAMFYFPSGGLQLVGAFKDGEKHGTWEFFNEQGKPIGREQWSGGVKP